MFLSGAVRSCAASHVGLASTLAADEGREGLDQVPGPVSRALTLWPADSAKVKLVSVIDHEDGRAEEAGFFQAIEKLLEKGCGPLKGLDLSLIHI